VRLSKIKEMQMDLLQWAFVAFSIAMMAGLLGFTRLVRASSTAKELFGLFLLIGVVFLALALLGVSILA
jgi:uncharacterized membrane protein YtjA (UPF0391 family)